MTALAAARDVLTQSEAEARAARMSNCTYTLALSLTRGSPAYDGDVTVTFDDSGSGDTFFDFRGKTIHEFTINSAAVEPDWTGYRLTLPGHALSTKNTVHIRYTNDYDHQGDGFHQFSDPEDGEEYLYTNFEPYESHRLFPQFDQPDIKATYSLTVSAPDEWAVITNARELSATPAADGRTLHQYETTKRFSTYLVCLCAGPFDRFQDRHGDVELGFYYRRSLTQYVDREELVTITRQGLDFYADFFGLAYPFGKYDQIFCPENNAGAMENVAAVTFNEQFIYRDPPTDSQRRRRAEVILHEMAHMWFGDLVTMRWWNDLWLNESFATYMSYLAMTSATRFTSGWQDFNAGMKNWAYRQDQLVTTHPISGVVADTDETFLNFDGITYGKGASVLKQLVAAIGMDGFREGMRHYFRTYPYSNATLAQFLASLEAGSGVDLKEWAQLWLETASLNTIGAKWEADGERISALSLTQTASSEYPTIRPHTLEIGLVREEAGSLTVESLPAAIGDAEVDVPAAIGRAKPSLVFPNLNDHGYFKVALDAESVVFARENMERIDDPLLRNLLWASLWSMVRDQQLKSTDFLAVVGERVAKEPRIELAEVVLSQAQTALARFVPDDMKEGEGHLLFATCYEALRAAEPGDAQITWMRAMIAAAPNAQDIGVLAALADGAEAVAGLTVDQQMRWSIAIKSVGYGLPGGSACLAAEALRDPSDRGQRELLRAETSAPDAITKAAAWEKFLGQGYGSLYLTESAMSGFNWPRQRDLLGPYVEKFFAATPEVFRTRDKEFYAGYFSALFPGYRVERAVLERGERLLAETEAELPVLARMLKEANDELGRAIKCREFAAS